MMFFMRSWKNARRKIICNIQTRMKKNILTAIFFAFLVSCNNSEKKVDPLQAKADSLQKEVLAGHDVAMPKSMKIPRLQKQIILRLPKHLQARFKRAANPVTMFIVNSFQTRATSLNSPFQPFPWRRKSAKKFPPLQFLEKIVQKGVTFYCTKCL